jgi:type IX secretion system PorP/SprF family membrane protein
MNHCAGKYFYAPCDRQTKMLFVMIFVFLANIAPSYLSAQDIHFTQFFTNPLIISPASTGYFQGSYRLAANYKYQWPWATQQTVFNYHTQAAYVDFSVLENKLKHGWLGLGANFLNDAAGDGRLRYMRFGASLAWHQAFDKRNRYMLSVGYICNIINKSVDFDRFYFNDQWVNDRGFDRTIPDYEHPNTTSIFQVDMGAGLNFNAKVSDAVLLSTTFSMLHLNRPHDQFYDTGNQIGFRYTATGGIEVDANRSISFQANTYFTYQQKAYELVMGAMAGIKPRQRHGESKSTIYLGSYYRYNDAVSPIVGYQYQKMRLLVNYDIITSRLSIPGQLNGGLEMSIVYIGSLPHHRPTDRKIACPKF